MFPRGKCFLRMRVFAYSTPDSENNVGLLVCLIVYEFYDLKCVATDETAHPENQIKREKLDEWNMIKLI